MTKTLEAVYDGKALRLDEPLDLKPNTRVRVTIVVQTDVPRKVGGSVRELFGSVDLGHPTGADNEGIDADLAQEYAATHEESR
jgi:predicted DNA-binding antitoxin AbrB/MazE fold protein